ncbi:MAG: hypothetical protein NT154_07355 [Verrucomicrobia bacterium]|nr:hypothetical protein [Verrucomicrobiota bacterium]
MKRIQLYTLGFPTLTIALFLGLPSTAQDTRIAARAARAQALLSLEILSAHLQATVYEVQAAPDRLASLDDKALTHQAATPESLLAELEKTGRARLLYHIEQPVNVFSSRCIIGASEPVISGTRKATTGQAINSISYQNVGCIVRLSAQPPPQDRSSPAPIVTTAIQLSVLTPGEKEIAPGQKDSASRVMSLDHSEPLELDRPCVVLAISSNAFSSLHGSDTGSGRDQVPATPVAYVVRYQFGPPAQGSSTVDSKPAAAADTTRSTNALTAQFQMTVYEVEAATNRLPTLDIKALERATTPEDLLRALIDAGSTKVLYRFDQPVNVFADKLMVQTNKPIVTATRMGRDGNPVNSFTYHNMGVIVQFSAQAPPEGTTREGPDVAISFVLSTDAPSQTALGLGQVALSFPVVSQEHNEPLEWNHPRLVLAMGSASASEQTKPFVYLVRYQFGPLGNRYRGLSKQSG